MRESVTEGGCQCGAVRYRLTSSPRGTGNCHCTSCRRSAGASPVAWATFARNHVETEGETLAWYGSSRGVERGFCRSCGTTLFYRTADSDTIDVTICSLDEPEHMPPEKEIWCDDAVSWVTRDPDRPRYPGWPS